MTVKPWDDSDIARASAKLDTELVEIFSEIEKMPNQRPPAEQPPVADDDPFITDADLIIDNFDKSAASGAQQYDEIGLPDAEILEEETEENEMLRPPGKTAAKVADLSPEELARLVERAAARGVLEALKKRF